MKIITSLLFLSLLQTAYAFETGRYRGESSEGNQVCELDITQKDKSFVINHFSCEDVALGRTIEFEPKEWSYGSFKKYYPEFKMTMTTEVRSNLYKMNYFNRDRSESYDEVLNFKNDKSVHYEFSVTHEGTRAPWFNLDLKMI